MARPTAHYFFKNLLLKKRIRLFPRQVGFSAFTLVETLIVVALIAVLASAVLASANYLVQIQKGKDARRKSDLALLKTKMEEYYEDNTRYPTASEMSQCRVALGSYIALLPCDPKGTPYFYETNDIGSWYRIYAKLDNVHDPIITALGCSGGCGPGTPPPYNYGVTSSNTSLVGSTGTCSGGVAPSCSSPGLYCGQVGTCCPGSEYVLSCSNGYYCCPI